MGSILPGSRCGDFEKIQAARDKLGDKGIVRSHPFSPGQGSPWQSFCMLVDVEPAIMLAMDEPGFVHHALQSILQRTLRVTEMWQGTPADMVETGGGAGSNTVISPKMFEEFCLPYDQRQHAALRAVGLKIVYHLCGGLMHLLELVAQNGAHGLETMTPRSMGGDCDLREASRRVGDRLFLSADSTKTPASSAAPPRRRASLFSIASRRPRITPATSSRPRTISSTARPRICSPSPRPPANADTDLALGPVHTKVMGACLYPGEDL